MKNTASCDGSGIFFFTESPADDIFKLMEYINALRCVFGMDAGGKAHEYIYSG